MNTNERAQGDALLTVRETIGRLNIGRTSLYHLIDRGEIKVVKFGRKVLVPVSEVDRWIHEHTGNRIEAAA